MVIDECLVGYTGNIAPVAALLRLFHQDLGFHRDFVRSLALTVRRDRSQDQGGGVWRNLGINALIGSGNQAVPFFDICINAAITAGPIGMFAKQADAPGDKEFHEDLVVRSVYFIKTAADSIFTQEVQSRP